MPAWVVWDIIPWLVNRQVLRLACQYVLSLRNIAVWPAEPVLHVGFDLW